MARRRRRTSTIDKTPQQAVIESLSHEGWGIARIEGKATFIQGALPGEEIEFIYTEKKKDYDKGICQQVFKHSADRVEPPCQHYDVCGGCSFQHLAPHKQIKFKQKVLLENLARIGGTQPERILEPLVGEQLGYRHKGRLSVRYVVKKDAVLVGFRERLSGRFIADIKQCQILHPKVGLLIEKLRELIGQLSNYRSIAQIELAVGENKTILILRHLDPLTETEHLQLQAFALEHQVCWYLQPGGEKSIHPLEPTENELLSYTIPELDLQFQFKPNDFTQVNPSINRQMLPIAIDLLELESTDRVLDLFCGLGNFSLPMARHALEVVGVEGCDKMTRRAESNAQLNGINNTEFYCANLFEAIEHEPWLNKKYNKILLDPPRAGAKEICQQIEKFQAEKVVYVSCATATLARDTKILVEKGYKLTAAGVMDMFPHTAHVESIALFTKM